MALIAKLIIIAHMMGCGWFLTTWVSPDDSNWVVQYDDTLLDGPTHRVYFLSVYWALTTLTTVGYGGHAYACAHCHT